MPAAPLPAATRANPHRMSPGGRVGAGILALACLTLLVIASGLSPDPSGSGTHTQLGLSPCGWVIKYNRPCPACGMTTAFAHAARVQPVAAVHAQPAGAIGALAAGTGFWAAAIAAATGLRLDRLLAPLLRPRMLWVGGGIVLLSWAYKFWTWSPHA